MLDRENGGTGRGPRDVGIQRQVHPATTIGANRLAQWRALRCSSGNDSVTNGLDSLCQFSGLTDASLSSPHVLASCFCTMP